MLAVATNSGSQDSPPLFAGVFFLLSGFDPTANSQLSEALQQHGGINVGEYNGSCTHVIVPRTFLLDDPVCAAARKDGKCLCTEIWVSDCLDLGFTADVNHVVYRPLRDSQGIPGTKKLVVCLTGYQGVARRNVMRMVHMMGAQFSKPLVANRITHLVCYKFEGEKFALAKQLGLKLVNHQWLEDCLRTWALLSEEDYTKSGFEVELSEVEAKDSEDDGNLKSTPCRSSVPKGAALPCSGSEREEVKLHMEVDKEHVDKRKGDCLSSPQKHENTPRKVNVTSIVGELQNVNTRVEYLSKMHVEGLDAHLTSLQMKGTRPPEVARSAKEQTIFVNVDDNDSLLRRGGVMHKETDSAGTLPLDGHDLGSTCKPEKVSKLATPAMVSSGIINFELAFKSTSVNNDVKCTTTPIPQASQCLTVSCEGEKMTLDPPVSGSTVTKRKSRLSAKTDVKVSRNKKQEKQSKKWDSSAAEKRIEKMVSEKVNTVDKNINGHPEVASSPKEQSIVVIADDNGFLHKQSGELSAAVESDCVMEAEGHESALSMCMGERALKGTTPIKENERTADLKLDLGSPPCLNKDKKVATDAETECEVAPSEVQNMPKDVPVVASTTSKGKRHQSAKADVKVTGTKRQGKQSKNSEMISTPKKAILTVEKMVSDKENVVCQSHDRKSDSKIPQKAPVAKKPSQLHEAAVKVTSQRCFALSGHRQEIKPLQALVKKLGGKLCRESHQWSHQTTHLVIARQLRRTEKFFAAAAAGRWILRDDYLRESSEAGAFLDEKKYEWHGVGMTKDGAISFEAPRKWREQRESTGCCALEGLRILLYGECIIPSLDTLRRAIQAGGGDLVATCPPYTKYLASKIDFAIVNPGTPKNDPWIQEFLSHDIACITTDFFVDFVCKPGSSLDRHILYDTHSLVQAVVARVQMSNAGAKRGRQESIDNEEGEGGDEDICCVSCGRSDREDVMLLCGDDKGSGCGTAMHIDCCKPPLEKVPANDWYCVQCTKPSSPLKRKKKKRALLKSK